MNPLTNVKNQQKLGQTEIQLGLVGTGSSWHNEYKDSAWVFIGGLPYELTEGDIVCIFSQYGEIVNLNLVRDKDSGKSKGFAFLCYEDQRSTILATDNLNGIKVLGRTLRVNHVSDYKVPKEHKNDDDFTKLVRDVGCAPEAMPTLQQHKPEVGSGAEEGEGEAFEKSPKKPKKAKKPKKEKKKKKIKVKPESESEESSVPSTSHIKAERLDPGYDRAAGATDRVRTRERDDEGWERERQVKKEVVRYREGDIREKYKEEVWEREGRREKDKDKIVKVEKEDLYQYGKDGRENERGRFIDEKKYDRERLEDRERGHKGRNMEKDRNEERQDRERRNEERRERQKSEHTGRDGRKGDRYDERGRDRSRDVDNIREERNRDYIGDKGSYNKNTDRSRSRERDQDRLREKDYRSEKNRGERGRMEAGRESWKYERDARTERKSETGRNRHKEGEDRRNQERDDSTGRGRDRMRDSNFEHKKNIRSRQYESSDSDSDSDSYSSDSDDNRSTQKTQSRSDRSYKDRRKDVG